MTEALVLAMAGGVVGVAMAWQAAPALAAMVPQAQTIAGLTDVRINLPVMLFAVGISLIAAVFSASPPILDCTDPRQAWRRRGARR